MSKFFCGLKGSKQEKQKDLKCLQTRVSCIEMKVSSMEASLEGRLSDIEDTVSKLSVSGANEGIAIRIDNAETVIIGSNNTQTQYSGTQICVNEDGLKSTINEMAGLQKQMPDAVYNSKTLKQSSGPPGTVDAQHVNSEAVKDPIRTEVAQPVSSKTPQDRCSTIDSLSVHSEEPKTLPETSVTQPVSSEFQEDLTFTSEVLPDPSRTVDQPVNSEGPPDPSKTVIAQPFNSEGLPDPSRTVVQPVNSEVPPDPSKTVIAQPFNSEGLSDPSRTVVQPVNSEGPPDPSKTVIAQPMNSEGLPDPSRTVDQPVNSEVPPDPSKTVIAQPMNSEGLPDPSRTVDQPVNSEVPPDPSKTVIAQPMNSEVLPDPSRTVVQPVNSEGPPDPSKTVIAQPVSSSSHHPVDIWPSTTDLKATDRKKTQIEYDRIKHISEELKRNNRNIITADVFYCKTSGRQLPFIRVESSDNVNERLKSYKGIPIEYRSNIRMSKEAQDVFLNEEEMPQKHKEEICKILRKFMKELDKYLSITARSMSYCKSIGYGTSNAKLIKKPCIVLYCVVKGDIPFLEEPYPTKLGKYDVDVREGYFQPLHYPYDIQSKLRAGAAIQIPGKGTCSLGPFFEHPIYGLCALTAGHGFVTKEEFSAFGATEQLRSHIRNNCFQVEQPPGSNRKIGNAIDIAIEPGDHEKAGIDIGVIKISADHEVDGPISLDTPEKLNEAGFDIRCPPAYNGKVEYDIAKWKDSVIYSIGPETGLTYGIVIHNGLFVNRVESDSSIPGIVNLYKLYNQLEIRPSVLLNPPRISEFSKPGDSCSLVFYKVNTELIGVGLLIGKTTYGSYVVTPLKEICNWIGIPEDNNQPFIVFSNEEEMDIDASPSFLDLSSGTISSTMFYLHGKDDLSEGTHSSRQNETDEIIVPPTEKGEECMKYEGFMSSKKDIRDMYVQTVHVHKDMAGGDAGLKKTAMEKNTLMYSTSATCIKEMFLSMQKKE